MHTHMQYVLLFNFIKGFGSEACFLIGVAVARDKTTAMVCLTLAVGSSGFAISGEYFFRVRKVF